MGTLLILSAALLISLSNLFMKKSSDGGRSTKAFLLFQCLIGGAVMILINPVRLGEYSCNVGIGLFGTLAGVLLGTLILSIGKAVEKGPPGLTFASFSSSTLFPAIFSTLLFGPEFGHIYTAYHAAGSIVVIVGLIWAGLGVTKNADTASFSLKPWLMMLSVAFSMHILFLILMQWRALMIRYDTLPGVLQLMLPNDAKSPWFMPFIYLGASLVIIIQSVKNRIQRPSAKESLYGILGGLANAIGTYFLITASEVATPVENAMLFPIFSITIIILCNSWGQILYQERVNWKAMNFCAFGLLIGGVDWTGVFKLISS